MLVNQDLAVELHKFVSVAGCLGYDVLVTNQIGLAHKYRFQLLVV